MTSYKIATEVHENGEIEQKITRESSFFDMSEVIVKEIFDTKEKQVREALIKLGWTPPVEE